MSNASSKRSVMTLFSNKNDIYCHQVKIVLAEKGVAYENEEVDLQALSEDLMELNPYGTLPTLVDRDLVLFSSRIIMEYLDERFPHPPLMPVYPVSRAKSRLLMLRIEQDWYPTLEIAEKGTEVEREEALKLAEEIGVTSASQRLGMNPNTIFNWRSRAAKKEEKPMEEPEIVSKTKAKAKEEKPVEIPHEEKSSQRLPPPVRRLCV